MQPLVTEAFHPQMEEFFNKHKEAGAGELARKQALETVRNNIKWTQKNYNAVSMWLESKEIKDTKASVDHPNLRSAQGGSKPLQTIQDAPLSTLSLSKKLDDGK